MTYMAPVLEESGHVDEDIIGKVGSWKCVGWYSQNKTERTKQTEN